MNMETDAQRLTCARHGPDVSSVGKPDAANRHVRFDGPGRKRAAAPFLDSTTESPQPGELPCDVATVVAESSAPASYEPHPLSSAFFNELLGTPTEGILA
jgi:hypothetical protein